MAKGKSNYNFQFNCSQAELQQLILNYLRANGFSLVENKGERYYRSGNAMIGYNAFNYNIVGQVINIQAWLEGVRGEITLEGNLSIQANNYKQSLNLLFQQIAKLNQGNYNMNNQVNTNAYQNTYGGNNQMNLNNGQQYNGAEQFSQQFQDEATKKKEKVCEAGFWISILGLLCALLGVAFGVILFAFDFYAGYQGLKTRKRGKAITTIVLSSISILILIIQLVA